VKKSSAMPILITVVMLLIAAGLATTGCTGRRSVSELTDAQIKAAAEKSGGHVDQYAGGMWAESKLPPAQAKKIKKEIEAGFEKAVKIWLSVKNNQDEFAEGMTGDALNEIKQQFKSELDQGKIKVRVHDDEQSEVVRVKEEAGAIAYSYIDNGYYIDAKTKQKISEPINEKREWLIGLLKVDGTWKISDIASLKPKGMEENH